MVSGTPIGFPPLTHPGDSLNRNAVPVSGGKLLIRHPAVEHVDNDHPESVTLRHRNVGSHFPALRKGVGDDDDRRPRHILFDQPLALGELARLVALSEYHFARMFSTSFGLPPHRYVLQRRLLRARRLRLPRLLLRRLLPRP